MENKHIYNEKELFLQVAHGDPDAFAVIYEKHYQSLFWHAFKLLKSDFSAEEIVQDVFVQLWVNREGLQRVEHPSSYLYKMVANKALDRIRKQELEVKMHYFIAARLHPVELETTGNEWDEIDLWIKEAIDSLPEQRKLIYQLKYHQGLSYEEIASQLSISKNTVRNQMVKALHTIRSYLINKKPGWLFFYFFLPIS